MKSETFNITRKQIRSIYDVACETWKSRILNLIKLEDEISLSYTQVKEMFDAANEDQKKVLKKVFPKFEVKKTIMERIKTFDDVLREIGKKYEDVIPWPKPINDFQSMMNAKAMAECVTEAYNEGEVLDWNNSNQRKYFLWFQRDARGGWAFHFVYDFCHYAYSGSGCYFKSEELAREAFRVFPKVFTDACPK